MQEPKILWYRKLIYFLGVIEWALAFLILLLYVLNFISGYSIVSLVSCPLLLYSTWSTNEKMMSGRYKFSLQLEFQPW